MRNVPGTMHDASDIADWLETPRGRYVMNWEQPHVDAQVADVFGYNALQLGLPQVKFLAHSRIPMRQIVGESGPVDVCCSLCELPFASASIDLVVMPHVLESHDDPQNSPGHYANMVSPDANALGIGMAYNSATKSWYATQNFAGYQNPARSGLVAS